MKLMTRSLRKALALIALVVFLPTPAQAKELVPASPTYNYGPEPDWIKFKALGEAAIRKIAVDPQSAQFEWPNGFKKGAWKPPLAARVHGYYTCGLVNARNHFGGYAGQSSFVVVIDHDHVVFADADQGGRGGANAYICGVEHPFPPPPDAPGPTVITAVDPVGIDWSIVPDGAYIASITPRGAASVAGLTPGQVVSHINGVALRGMPLATVRQIVAGAGPKMTLAIVGGQTLTLDAANRAPVSVEPDAETVP